MQPNPEDWLDRQLRDVAPYIEDAGFTQRVLRQLPARRQRSSVARPFILIGMSVLASVLAYFLSDGGRFLIVEMTRLSALPVVWLFALVIGSGVLLMSGGLAAAAMSKTIRIEP